MGQLTFILGRSGVGKTRQMLEKIKGDTRDVRHIILAPDQHTHEVERELCTLGGDSISMKAEVLTFSRLSNHVFYHCGGLEDPELDGAGRMLLLYRSVMAVQERLGVLSHYTQHPTFYEKLMKTVDELKTNQVATDVLFALEEEEKSKLTDIALVCSFYDCYTQALSENQRENLVAQLQEKIQLGAFSLDDLPLEEVQFDPRDRLTRMADKLGNSDWGKGKVFWLDGFADFTPQQQQVLRHLMAQGESVTVNLMGDYEEWVNFQGQESLEFADCIFFPAYETIEKLSVMAKKENIKVSIKALENPYEVRNQVLAHLEKSLFAQEPQKFQGEFQGEIKLISAESLRFEVEWTASEILRLVQDEDYRFRDIVVVARDFTEYRYLISSIFPRYGIPVFTTQMVSILEKPVISVVATVFQAIVSGYRYVELFRYLKTGFSSLSPWEVDLLEEYVLLWNISGKDWKKEFTGHPERFDGEFSDRDKKKLQLLNDLRNKVMEPLLVLAEETKGCSAAVYCEKLYDFLEHIKLYGKMRHRQTELEESGDLLQSEEYNQLWGILIGCLEETHDLSGGHEISFQEFTKMFTLVMAQCNVGTIPVALDQVTAGETTRLKNRRGKVVFWLGAEDSTVPMPSDSGGLFSDLDRLTLEKLQVTLNQRAEQLMQREFTTAYEICALGSEKFYLSWPSRKQSGRGCNPCFLVKDICGLFPQLQIFQEEKGDFRLKSPLPALEQVGQFPFVKDILKEEVLWQKEVERLEAASVWGRGALGTLGREILYGEEVTFSATRLEKLNSCLYAYFLQYGLRAKPRKVAEFSALEFGTFVHMVLESLLSNRKTHKEVEAMGYVTEKEKEKFREQEKIDSVGKVKTFIEGYLTKDNEGDYVREKSPREVHLFTRLTRNVEFMVKEAFEELNLSQFDYVVGEKQFIFDLEQLCGVGQEQNEEIEEVQEMQENKEENKDEKKKIAVKFTGSIDRVDGYVCKEDGVNYFHLVDYKTGKKSFSVVDLLFGRDLQLPLYYLATLAMGSELLDCLCENEKERNYPVKGGAFTYFPAKEVEVTGSSQMKEEDLLKLRQKELKRIGVYYEKESVIEALEKGQIVEKEVKGVTEVVGKKYRFLPLEEKKDVYSGKELMGDLALGKMMALVKSQLCLVPDILDSGEISANPYKKIDKATPCGYCDFKDMCFFEDGCRGESYRQDKAALGKKTKS